jgi:CubicO group peptidase (beta-lactamase class C family)
MKLQLTILVILVHLAYDFKAQSVLPKNELTLTFDSLIAGTSRVNEPGGVAIVARKGEIIYRKAFGMANLELDVAANDSMIFYIGSNTKQFTAVAILQMLEKGKLQLHDTVGKFITLAPFPVSSITLQQLLSHTSGIVSNNEAEVKKLLTGQSADKSIRMEFAPGTRWEYNNTNYSVLGFVIEKITGKSYADYIHEHIFKPAGMLHSYIDDDLSIIKNRATGYRYFKGRFLNSRAAGKIGAAGGMLSTGDDMFKWMQALKNGILLKAQTLGQAFTPQQLLNGTFTSYGFGWHLEQLRGSSTRRHGGMVPGYMSETLYLPEEDVYVVILTNAEFSPIPITALSRIMAGWAMGKPYIFRETPIRNNELKKFIGLYENEYGELLNITEQNEKLVFQRPNGTQYNLGYAGNNEFFFYKDFLRVHFNTGASGKITSLQFSKVDIGMTEWFKKEKPPLRLAAGRIEDSILSTYPGTYFLDGNDTITITRDGVSLYYKTSKQPDLLLVAEDNTHFYALKNDLRITFITDQITNAPALSITQNKKNKRYLKL